MSHDPHTKALDARDRPTGQLERTDLLGTTALAAVLDAPSERESCRSAAGPAGELASQSEAVSAGDNFVREPATGNRTGSGADDRAAAQPHHPACPPDASSIRAGLGIDDDNARESRLDTAAPPPDRAEALELAERIKARNRWLDRSEGSNALENGRDLHRIKALLPFGDFGRWCKRELNYSKSKAEKEMRVAEVLGPYFKSVTVTDLLPKTLAYIISSGAVPQHIRDEFMPRIVAGEEVCRQIKAAIKKHRDQVRAAEREGSVEPRACTAKVEDEVAQSEETQALATTIEPESATAASADALALIVDRLGSDLPVLIALLDEAGPGAVFAPAAEGVLRDRASAIAQYKDNDPTPIADVDNELQPPAVDVADPISLNKKTPFEITPAQQLKLANIFSTPSSNSQKTRRSL